MTDILIETAPPSGLNRMSLIAIVAQRITDSAPAVTDEVVDQLVDAEVGRRVKMISDALAKIDDLTRDSRKLKADVVAFNEDGSIASEAFSKARLDERKKSKEQIDKLAAAIDKALLGDMAKLAEIAKPN